jgi:homoserine kinase type II
MAVYTDVNEDQLRAFLAEYDVGTLLSYKGIAEGVENSNFLLRTSGGTFILTLYEKRVNRDDLPFFLGLMDHLALKGLSCPLPIERRDGGHLGELAGRPAAMVSFLDGAWLRKPQAPHCREVGRALAAMHVAGSDFPIRRANGLTVANWRPCGKVPAPAPTRSSPACARKSISNWRSSRKAGPQACPRA